MSNHHGLYHFIYSLEESLTEQVVKELQKHSEPEKHKDLFPKDFLIRELIRIFEELKNEESVKAKNELLKILISDENLDLKAIAYSSLLYAGLEMHPEMEVFKEKYPVQEFFCRELAITRKQAFISSSLGK
jgi:hypothetical protein